MSVLHAGNVGVVLVNFLWLEQRNSINSDPRVIVHLLLCWSMLQTCLNNIKIYNLNYLIRKKLSLKANWYVPLYKQCLLACILMWPLVEVFKRQNCNQSGQTRWEIAFCYFVIYSPQRRLLDWTIGSRPPKPQSLDHVSLVALMSWHANNCLTSECSGVINVP